ncbi:MAG: WavE lipopolysaccharide synthesis family protein [Spirochaetia bacterium]|jgi:hypothetical protein|nr:WavE lipopolysaccharide synthesis family protein [Spirochaetia bacterium]
MITPHDISLVVQGALDRKDTPKCLRSIRESLPGAEIILSTWEGSDVSSLDYDVLVLNKDPGSAFQDIRRKARANINRQLVSTQNGIAKASRKYIMKLRSDLILSGAGFLWYFDKFPFRDSSLHFLAERIMVPTVFSRLASSQRGLYEFSTPFHVSDWWFFGLADDIRSYFEQTQLVNLTEYSNYKNLRHPEKRPYPHLLLRYSPEQYLCYSFFKRHIPNLRFDDWTDFDEENNNESMKLLANNFIFLDPCQHMIACTKYKQAKPYDIPGCMTFDKFLGLYNEFAIPGGLASASPDSLVSTNRMLADCLISYVNGLTDELTEKYETDIGYRFGRALFWLPRSVYRFFPYLSNNGVRLTAKYILRKLTNGLLARRPG